MIKIIKNDDADNTNQSVDLIGKFWKQNRSRRRFLSKRDNCGEAAAYLVEFLKTLEIASERKHGYFIADTPLHDYHDFLQQQIQDMIQKGFDPNKDSDRLNYMIANNLGYECKKIPHYWVELENGRLLDPVGDVQFIRSGLAADLNDWRYVVFDWYAHH